MTETHLPESHLPETYLPETHLPESQLTKFKQPESHLITISNNVKENHWLGGFKTHLASDLIRRGRPSI